MVRGVSRLGSVPRTGMRMGKHSIAKVQGYVGYPGILNWSPPLTRPRGRASAHTYNTTSVRDTYLVDMQTPYKFKLRMCTIAQVKNHHGGGRVNCLILSTEDSGLATCGRPFRMSGHPVLANLNHNKSVNPVLTVQHQPLLLFIGSALKIHTSESGRDEASHRLIRTGVKGLLRLRELMASLPSSSLHRLLQLLYTTYYMYVHSVHTPHLVLYT